MRDRDSFNRIISLAALVATLFLMLFSSFYITEHANHHCDDEAHCPVCAVILQCENNIKSIGTGLIIVMCAVFSYSVVSQLFNYFSFQSIQTTLVSQRVRLNN